jgi:hypothetical protein
VVTTLAPRRSSHASMLGCRQRAVTHGSSSTSVARSHPRDSACIQFAAHFAAHQSLFVTHRSTPATAQCPARSPETMFAAEEACKEEHSVSWPGNQHSERFCGRAADLQADGAGDAE